MDFKDIQNKSEKDLHDLLIEKRNDVRDFRFRASEGQLKNVRGIREAKKTIAHILTELKNRATLAPQKKTEETK
jgi:ribosomal protein L29